MRILVVIFASVLLSSCGLGWPRERWTPELAQRERDLIDRMAVAPPEERKVLERELKQVQFEYYLEWEDNTANAPSMMSEKERKEETGEMVDRALEEGGSHPAEESPVTPP